MTDNIFLKTVYPFSSTFLDYPDNISDAILIYIVGCSHNCLNCHNPRLHNIDVCGEDIVIWNIPTFLSTLNKVLQKQRTNKVIFSGGDPLYKTNLNFIQQILQRNALDKKINICIYTGYNVDYCKQHNITNFNFLKCGLYDVKLKQLSEKNDQYIQFASSNQILYNEDYKQLTINGRYTFKV